MNKKEAREFLRKQANNVWLAFKELSVDELIDLRKIAAEYSTTNCWYGEYYMKDSFLKMIDGRISDIKTLQDASKRTT